MTIPIKRPSVVFGLTCTPSEFLSNNIENVTKIQLTFGGGMGGSHVEKYGVIEKQENGFIYFTDIFGEKSTLNERYVVSISEKQLVTCIFDITKHANHREHRVNSRIKTTYSIVNQNVNIKFNDEYQENQKQCIYSNTVNT